MTGFGISNIYKNIKLHGFDDNVSEKNLKNEIDYLKQPFYFTRNEGPMSEHLNLLIYSLRFTAALINSQETHNTTVSERSLIIIK